MSFQTRTACFGHPVRQSRAQILRKFGRGFRPFLLPFLEWSFFLDRPGQFQNGVALFQCNAMSFQTKMTCLVTRYAILKKIFISTVVDMVVFCRLHFVTEPVDKVCLALVTANYHR